MKFQSKASKGVGKRKGKLQPIRDNLQVLVDRANFMVSQLMDAGLENSPALIYARETLKGDAEQLFSVADKHRYRELRREAARLDSFLSEAESQVKIANATEYALKATQDYGLSFHRQAENLARTGFRFGTADEERVKFAAEIFRRIKEDPDNVLAFAKGSDRFNSDTVFNMIYAITEDYDPNSSDEDKDALKNLAITAAKLAAQEHVNYEQGFLNGAPYVNIEKDVISSIKSATSTEEFLKNNQWLLNNV